VQSWSIEERTRARGTWSCGCYCPSVLLYSSTVRRWPLSGESSSVIDHLASPSDPVHEACVKCHCHRAAAFQVFHHDSPSLLNTGCPQIQNLKHKTVFTCKESTSRQTPKPYHHTAKTSSDRNFLWFRVSRRLRKHDAQNAIRHRRFDILILHQVSSVSMPAYRVSLKCSP